MSTACRELEYPMWKDLARAVISRGALDYVLAFKLLAGESIPKTPLNYPVRAHPEKIRDECEDFFFSSWFRILSDDMGLDGMLLATQIEKEWRDMYDRAKKAKSGRPAGEHNEDEERQRKRARERLYYQKHREQIAEARKKRKS